MHDDRVSDTELELEVLSPSRLHAMGKTDLKALCRSFKMYPKKTQAIILRNLCNGYHRWMDDPMKAVEELVMRVVYEIISGRIKRNSRWLMPHKRDAGHHTRMWRLVSSILTSEAACKYCAQFRWLGFKKAIRRARK